MYMKKTNKKHYLLVDGEGLLHQSFHKFTNLKSSNGTPTGALFGFFKLLRMYIYRFSPDDVYVVFDNGHSKYRTKLLGSYKEHRKRIDIDYESLQSQKALIIKTLRALRIKYIFDKKRECNYEGDDFLAYLVLKWLPRKSKITLVTIDKDFNQLLRGKLVKIYNPRKDQLIYESNCMTLFGYHARETVDYLCLVGDSSDDIPGYRGLGPKKTRWFLDHFKSIENYLESGEFMKDDPDGSKMKECWERNRQLIDLKWFCNKYTIKKLPLVEKAKMKTKVVDRISYKYDIGSFKDNSFINIFKEQEQRTYGKRT